MSLDHRLNRLADAYRRIGADARFAERVTTAVIARRRQAALSWLPAATAATLAAVVIAALLLQRPAPSPDVTVNRVTLSLPAMPGAIGKPSGLRMTLPGLGRARPLPVLPPTPAPIERRRHPDSTSAPTSA